MAVATALKRKRMSIFLAASDPKMSSYSQPYISPNNAFKKI